MSNPKRNILGLTEKEVSTLSFIIARYEEQGYPPTVRELKEYLGVQSTSTALSYMKNLEEYGFLRRDAAKSRAIEILRYPDGRKYTDTKREIPLEKPAYVPLMKEVLEGEQIFSKENIDRYLPLPSSMIANEKLHFAIVVQDDSLKDIEIKKGDIILAEQRERAKQNDLIVIYHNGNWLVRRYIKKRGYIELNAENKEYLTMAFRNLCIKGIVKGHIQKPKKQ